MSLEFILLVIFFILSILLTTIIFILSRRKSRRKIFIDTSVLIDGRILEIIKTGFLGDLFFIPRSVIRELQLLADGKNSEKRVRARFGMDIANDLQKSKDCAVFIYTDKLDKTPVDERLIELAKKEHGLILTMDFNLGKVAESENIKTLNLNDLILALRQENLNGERMKIKIRSEGSNNEQGIGYLEDGTMVVVDGAKRKIGKELEVEFKNALQTSSGKIWFAKIAKKNKK